MSLSVDPTIKRVGSVSPFEDSKSHKNKTFGVTQHSHWLRSIKFTTRGLLGNHDV